MLPSSIKFDLKVLNILFRGYWLECAICSYMRVKIFGECVKGDKTLCAPQICGVSLQV